MSSKSITESSRQRKDPASKLTRLMLPLWISGNGFLPDAIALQRGFFALGVIAIVD